MSFSHLKLAIEAEENEISVDVKPRNQATTQQLEIAEEKIFTS
jgi:hypothetical protein